MARSSDSEIYSLSDDIVPTNGSPELNENTSLNGSISSRLMEESFTVNLGAQLKTMHNVRLVVMDKLGVCLADNENSGLVINMYVPNYIFHFPVFFLLLSVVIPSELNFGKRQRVHFPIGSYEIWFEVTT